MLWWLTGMILGKIICKSSNWQHIQRWKITILGANWQLFRLERMPNVHILFCLHKISGFVVCNENKEIYVANLMIKYRLISSRNQYFGVFVLNGLKEKCQYNWRRNGILVCFTNTLHHHALRHSDVVSSSQISPAPGADYRHYRDHLIQF